jgi:hypothetical protein
MIQEDKDCRISLVGHKNVFHQLVGQRDVCLKRLVYSIVHTRYLDSKGACLQCETPTIWYGRTNVWYSSGNSIFVVMAGP